MANLSDSSIDLDVRTTIANKALELANAWMEYGSYSGTDFEQHTYLLNKAFDMQEELRTMAVNAGNIL